MLVTVILFSFSFWLFAVYGFAAVALMDRFVRSDSKSHLPIPINAIVGFVVISVLASFANIFLNLGLTFAVFLLAGGVIIHWRINPFQGLSLPLLPIWIWMLIVLVFLTVLEISTHRPSVSDTALYHAQTIRWFETYPAVPGLGNLHHRLAFNSSWLVLNAALSFSFLEFQSFHLVSGFFFLLAQLFFLGGLADLFQGKLSWSGMFKILSIPLGFYLFSSVISSPAYDMPVSLLTWIIVALWLEAEGLKSKGYDSVIFLLSVYAVTIKLSALPLLLFPAWILINKYKTSERRVVTGLIVSAMLIMIPWVARSVILSGYLMFPLSQLDLFAFDWKISSEQVDGIRQSIAAFARLPGRDWESALTMKFSEWFPLWFGNLSSNQQGTFGFVVVSPLIFALLRRLNPTWASPTQLFGYFVLYVGMVFWFVTAPDIRFGYGFLAGITLLIVSPGLLMLIRRVDPAVKFAKQAILLGLLLFQLYSFTFSFEPSTLAKRAIYPVEYSRSRAESCDLKNATVYCRVQGGQCNYEIFPCIPSPRPNVELRGDTFQDGFRESP